MERRKFLKLSASGFASSFLLGGASLTVSKRATAAIVDINLSAEEVMKNVAFNRDVLTWQFVNANQPGPGALASGIVVSQGDTVNINVQNNISQHEINFIIPGIRETSLPIPPGASASYSFTANKVGSYLYLDNRNGFLGRAMGLMGPLTVLPADGSQDLTPALVTQNIYDRQYIMVLNEIDSRVNDAIAAGLAPNIDEYLPDYYFVNGLSYPDTVYDAAGNIDDNKVIYMLAGENVAIRFVNGGLIYYPMHFHGYHVNVISRNRQLERFVVEKDTVLVKQGECVDSVLSVGNQLGLYPIHTHYTPGVTTAGFYAGGGLLMMKAV